MNYIDFVPILKALADETRLRIVKMLSDGELCACKILEHFSITQPTLSYHMRILCESGIVEGRKEGSWMRYSLNYEVFEDANKLFNSFLANRRDKSEGAQCGGNC